MELDKELMQLVEEELQAFDHIGDWWCSLTVSFSPNHQQWEPVQVAKRPEQDQQWTHVQVQQPRQPHQAIRNKTRPRPHRRAPKRASWLVGLVNHDLRPRKKPRRRPHTDLIDLRQQVQLLEHRLRNAQDATTTPSSSSSSSESTVSWTDLGSLVWKIVAKRERAERLKAEQSNLQLKQRLAAHVYHLQAVQRHLMLQREECEMACWILNDPLTSRAALTFPSPPFKSKRIPECARQQAADGTKGTLLMAESRLWLLSERLDSVWRQLDLVFRRNALSERLDASTACSHQLKIRCGFNVEPAVLFEDGFVELVASTVTCFDAKTLLELLWKCFLCQSMMQSTDSSGHATVFIPAHNEKRIPTQQRQGPRLGSTMQLRTGRVLDAIETHLVDDVMHARAHFVIALCQSRSEKHQQAQIAAQGALRRLEGGIVSEAFGRVQLDEATQIAFNRSEWIRIEALADGRSVIHHVHRVRPLIPRMSSTPSSLSEQVGALVDPLIDKQQHVQLFAELVQRIHRDMWTQFRERMIKACAEQLVGPHNNLMEALGWPFEA